MRIPKLLLSLLLFVPLNALAQRTIQIKSTAKPIVALSIKGSISLIDTDFGHSGENCLGLRGFSDIAGNIPVIIKNESGLVIASGETQKGVHPKTADRRIECVFFYDLKVPPANFYTIEVGRRGKFTLSKDELEKRNWTLATFLSK
jgi:hypothetical protein